MKIVVIGGNGFLGSHFVAGAVDRGHEAVVCEWQDRPRYAHGRPFSLIRGGIQGLIENIGQLNDADIVCHFASSTIPGTSNINPIGDIEDNLVQGLRLLEAMRNAKCKRVLYLSSGGAVYGRPQYSPMDEEHPQHPISSYGIVKGTMERYLELYAMLHGFEVAIVRPSNPYGPGQDQTAGLGVITAFLGCAKRNEPIKLYGDGSVIRDFIYITDLTDLLLRVVEQNTTGVFNCGRGHGVSLIELTNVIAQIVGRPLARQYLPARAFDPPAVVLDIERAKERLGWRPVVSLEEGVRRTWESIRDLGEKL